MAHSGNYVNHEIRDIDRRLSRLEHEVAELRKPKPLTRAGAVIFSLTGDTTMNSLTLLVGQKASASIATYLADGVTPSGATLSNIQWNFTDPSASVTINADGTATIIGLAPSANGPVAGTVSNTATDTDNAVSTWSLPFTIQVAAPPPPPPAQLTQSEAVVFSVPA